eukprot:NODE_7376_length_571_cov_25.340996_g6364_i0.p3 GENE.NODE_7376_length_571_cov_25.340996_g6364_i0~~NODE_7376_length_571_cov_25.340996_g6364_i0.p3  ORF type:complete len:64 (+),score=1.54 NODE_7376_length_571_cov_25.340996_g6364_i0:161-352(+)
MRQLRPGRDRPGPAAAKLLALTSRRPNGPARPDLGCQLRRMHTQAAANSPSLWLGPTARRPAR